MHPTRFFLLAIPILCSLIYCLKHVNNAVTRKKCTGITSGKFAYSEEIQNPNPRYPVYYWFPYYEYSIENIVYIAKIEKRQASGNNFPYTVDVYYNPQFPEICYIDGKRAEIVSKHEI